MALRTTPSPWDDPGVVAGFAQSLPNSALMASATRAPGPGPRRLLDIGCGAGRNAVPLAEAGWDVSGVDLSFSMLGAARSRAGAANLRVPLHLVQAPMDQLPFTSRSMGFIVAHGIWNLARSAGELRGAAAEAGRVARPGAALFVFMFSRETLPADAQPVAGHPYVFTRFSGQPQTFLTVAELVGELATAGFEPDGPVREINRPPAGALRLTAAPVFLEGLFVHAG